MQRLNLPTYSFTIKSEGNRRFIFDPVRKKYVALTPEEWVRQNFARYLVDEKACPLTLIAIEKQFVYNRMSKRADILVYGKDANPLLMVECKAPSVKITQAVFDQVALYNLRFALNYLVVTNGLKHYCCRLNAGDGNFTFLEEIPEYPDMQSGSLSSTD